MPCGWEGNHRSGHATQTLLVLHLRALGLEEGDEHLPMLSCGAWSTLPLPSKNVNPEHSFIGCICWDNNFAESESRLCIDDVGGRGETSASRPRKYWTSTSIHIWATHIRVRRQRKSSHANVTLQCHRYAVLYWII